MNLYQLVALELFFREEILINQAQSVKMERAYMENMTKKIL